MQDRSVLPPCVLSWALDVVPRAFPVPGYVFPILVPILKVIRGVPAEPQTVNLAR